MIENLEETVILNKDDCYNILAWWTHSVMMAEAGERGPIRDSERETIAKLEEVRMKIAHRSKRPG